MPNVFESIVAQGHDDDFEPPKAAPGFVPTAASPGSPSKIAVLILRVRMGLPLWHPDDSDQADRSTQRRR